MNLLTKWITGLLAFILVTGWGVSFYSQNTVVVQNAKLNDTIASLISTEKKQSLVNEDLTAQLVSQQASANAKRSLLGGKKEFKAKVQEFSAVLEKAVNKVDSSAEKAIIIDSQNKVLIATDVEQISALTVLVSDTTAGLLARITAFDEEARKAEQQSQNSSSNNGGANGNSGNSSGNWFDEMRTILNNVGGSHIELQEGDCARAGYSLACAGGGTIFVNSGISSLVTVEKFGR